MSLRRLTATTTVVLGIAGVLTVSVLARQQMTKPMPDHDMMGGMKAGTTMTKAQKIANAVSAAPANISAKATVLDYPVTEGAAPAVLRPGTNRWSCFPDMPDTKGNDPMCLDEPWAKWLEAYLAKKTPHITRVGIGYMMAPGGAWGSNSDPFAMKEMPGNHWGQHSPHLMILVPDAKALEGISTDPNNGGPYVMWAGTPYVHIMAPTSTPAAMMHK